MFTVTEKRIGDPYSNPGWGRLYFTVTLMILEKENSEFKPALLHWKLTSATRCGKAG